MAKDHIIAAEYQSELPLEQLILSRPPEEDNLPMDVVFVGAGPAGLAGAIELDRLVKEDNKNEGGIGDIEIAVLEKAAKLGNHSLSGAVVNPCAFRELFPDLKDEDFPFRQPVKKERVYFMTDRFAIPIPTPPTMRNHGNYVASICEIVQWLGEKAEEQGIAVLTGTPAQSLLVEENRVTGVVTTPWGLDRDGNPKGGYQPSTDISSKITVLTEGTRGPLSQSYLSWQGISSQNPQIFALGVKEIWETKVPLDKVIHTMGWPLSTDTFGGSFMYPLEDNLIALGLVVGLDSPDASLDVHELFQRMKQHPLFSRYLKGGQMVEWGAKTIPEGGYYSIPSRLSGDGILLAGDCAGLVDVPSLKGIHYAIQSGIYAARAVFAALKADDTTGEQLKSYDTMINESYITSDLYRTRNFRQSFKHGFFAGGLLSTIMTLTGGRFPGKKMSLEEDASEAKRHLDVEEFIPDGEFTFGKLNAVYMSGNNTRDDIPSHLILDKDIPREVAEMYVRMCPAGVYELEGDKLKINPSNCIDCKATDVLGPRWTPREGGSGPQYRRM